MDISVKEFQVTVSENELWALTHALREDLEQEDKAKHSGQFSGWKTFLQNYGTELNMFQKFCERLGRSDLHNTLVELQKSRIETEQNRIRSAVK